MNKDELQNGAVKARGLARRLSRNDNFVLVWVLVALTAVFAVATKGFILKPANVSNIIVQSSIRGVATIGQSFVILAAGIDLAVGGIETITMVVGGLMITGTAGFPAAGIAVMILLGMAVGSTSGFTISRLGLPPLMVTLALWTILKGISLFVTKGYSIVEFPTELAFIGQGNIGPIPVPTIIFITMGVIAYLILTYTTFGRSVYATGGNPTSAWLTGINVRSVLLWVYIISGFSGALAGVITMSRTMASSLSAAAGLELDAIAASVIGGLSLAGGRGNLIGAILGVIIIGVLNNGMNVVAIHPAFQDVAKGGIIAAAVAIDYVRRSKG